MVWTNILPSDTNLAAQRASALFNGFNVIQFYDKDQIVGKAWVENLGIKNVAWDVYLLFGANKKWQEQVPSPSDWFHQLGGAGADPSRFHTASDLAQALYYSGEKIGWPVAALAPDSSNWIHSHKETLSRLDSKKSEEGERCLECKAVGQLSSCSLGGWNRLMLRIEEGHQLMVSAEAPLKEKGDRQEIRLAVSGMNCPECMMRASAGAMSVKGVNETEVKLATGEMRALLLSNAVASDEEIAKAIEAEGFKVHLVGNGH